MIGRIYFLIFFLLTNYLSSFSQDIILTRRDTILGNVISVDSATVRYFDIRYPKGPEMVILKEEISEIIYWNGSIDYINSDPVVRLENKKVLLKEHILKIEFFSPIAHNITFGYESFLGNNISGEVKLGIIGPGVKKEDEPAHGFLIKGGIKFYSLSNYSNEGMPQISQLHGSYVKAEIIFNSYSKKKDVRIYDPTNYYIYYTSKEDFRFYNLGLDFIFGRQVILRNNLTFEYYFGMGLGTNNAWNKNISTNEVDADFDSPVYSHRYLWTTALFVTGGITLGYSF